MSPPGVFLGRGTALPADRDPVAWVEDRYQDIHRMSGYEVPEAVRTEVKLCLDRLPVGAGPSSVGFFLGRPHHGLRVCLGGLGLLTASEYLEALDYVGDSSRFRSELEDVRADAPGILGEIGLVHLDVGAGRIGPRIGVELVFEFKRQASRYLLSTEVLQALVRKGLADPAKCDALASWPGAFYGGTGQRTICLRRVNHVKLVFERDRVVEAKAYFGIRAGVPRFVDPAKLGAVEGEVV